MSGSALWNAHWLPQAGAAHGRSRPSAPRRPARGDAGGAQCQALLDIHATDWRPAKRHGKQRRPDPVSTDEGVTHLGNLLLEVFGCDIHHSSDRAHAAHARLAPEDRSPLWHAAGEGSAGSLQPRLEHAGAA